MGIKLYLGIFLQCLGVGLTDFLRSTSFRWLPYVIITIGTLITLICSVAVEARLERLTKSLVAQKEINACTEQNMKLLANYLNSSNARLTTIKGHIDQILKMMNEEETPKTVRITDSNKEKDHV